MNAKQHIDMLIHSAKLVLGSIILVILTLVLVALIMVASVSYVQHRVDVNMRSLEVTEHEQVQTETNWR